MDNERWIPGYEGEYSVSDDGIVYRYYNGKHVVHTYVNKGGYVIARVGAKQYSVHKLVMLAWVGERPDGMVICHYNDVKTDNRLSNLRYDTNKANAADRRRNRAK